MKNKLLREAMLDSLNTNSNVIIEKHSILIGDIQVKKDFFDYTIVIKDVSRDLKGLFESLKDKEELSGTLSFDSANNQINVFILTDQKGMQKYISMLENEKLM